MVYTIHMTSRPETEKITINLGFVDLGQIDLLAQEGFYSNRSDFIRTAIRNQLRQHQPTLDRSCDRRGLHLGLYRLERGMLEQALARGVRLDVRVLGLLSVAPEVDAELVTEAVGDVQVLGAIDANPAIRAMLSAMSKGHM